MTTASARDEMCTLYLIGAAPGFAARPYAWRGMVLMGTAAAAALGLSAAGIKLLQPYLDRAAALYGGSVTSNARTLFRFCCRGCRARRPHIVACRTTRMANHCQGPVTVPFSLFALWETLCYKSLGENVLIP